MAQNLLTMTFLFCPPYDIITWAGHEAFNISDPKPRHIHKASVRDRLLRHAIYRILYPFFDRTFISDSYSCRLNKGMHKAINQFQKFFYKVSRNNTRTCWVLKGDIRKFFASIVSIPGNTELLFGKLFGKIFNEI